jgi:two-component system KDP operon response regulator KdpE
MKILVVDDEDDTRQWLKDLLWHAGHRVTEAASGREGLDALEGGRFDLVLLDLMMPDIDGFEVIRSLTGYWTNMRVPVIVISCRRDRNSRSFARVFGCVRFLEKPFEPRQLFDALRVVEQGGGDLIPA